MSDKRYMHVSIPVGLLVIFLMGLAETFKVGKLTLYSSQSLIITIVAATISIIAARRLKESIFLRLTTIASLVMVGWILIEMTMRYR